MLLNRSLGYNSLVLCINVHPKVGLKIKKKKKKKFFFFFFKFLNKVQMYTQKFCLKIKTKYKCTPKSLFKKN